MKRILLLLAFTSTAQAVESPCYWQGSSVLCLPSQGIFLDNNKTVRYGEATTNGVNYVEVIAPASLASNFVMSLPAATDTFVGKATTDTFTNKSIDADGTGNSITNIENADIKAAAAIAVNKLAAITASRAVVSDGSGFVSPATTTSTEIGFVNGVTSSIQTQLNTKTINPGTTTGDIFYCSNTATPCTATRLAIGTSAQTLHGGTTPAYAAVALGADVSGQLPIGNGGTGAATKAAGFDALSPMTTAGDVIYGGTSGTGTRLAAGSATQLLHSGTTPTWSAISLTADVTGILPIANGGSNKALTLAAGGLIWGDSDSFEMGAAGTASDWALSGGTGAPTFSSTTTTAKLIDGSADAIQLTVQGNATQTSDILVAEKSDGTDLLEVTNVNGTKIRGTTTNDSAATGFVGYIASVSSSGANSFPTSGQYGGDHSITLDAGDYDLNVQVSADFGSASTFTTWDGFIGTASGNNATGRVIGDNFFTQPPPTAVYGSTGTVSSYRVTISGSTTYYLKLRGTYTGTAPTYSYRFSARTRR